MLLDISTLLYKTQKAVAAMPYLYEQTNKVVHKNMRLGQSITGITQSLDKLQWLDPTYKALRTFDVEWSKAHKWNTSIKLTSVKPSGTVSILTGSTPGIHPAFAEYYKRRIRVASDSSLIPYLKSHGYHVEYAQKFDGSFDYITSVVTFPIHIDALYAKDINAVTQLELVKTIQTLWADNSVSVTIYYKKEELAQVQEWLKNNYETSLKAVSFLLHSDHGFKQAPYEEISAEEYNTMVETLSPLIAYHEYIELGDDECANGTCPIR